MMIDQVKEFLKTQELLTIACSDSDEIWTANVYYGCDDNAVLYFISSKNTKHSKMILKNPKIAFNTVWFDKKDYANRKAVQGIGVCRVATTLADVAKGVALHNKRFPAFANKITGEWIKTNEFGSRVWTIIPEYIKYWDDELYGEDEFAEVTVSRETNWQTINGID